MILFGGMFIVYAVYRFQHPDEFRLASAELDSFTGTINTMILLASSLSIALSITAMHRGKNLLAKSLVIITIALGLIFLVNKYFEWSHKFSLGIYPRSPVLDSKPAGEILYFGLYYVMTGLHGIHVVVGVVILAFMFVFISKGIIRPRATVRLEAGALYWHLVDIIWIFLFPLFYLIH
jgi:cytochrome c oxidase subunit 3